MFDETRSTLSSHDQTTVRGLVDPSGTDGFAIASLVCGLLGLVPLGVGLGIRALIRTGRSGRPGRGLAIAGLTLSVIWLGLGIGLATAGSKLLTHSASGRDYIHVMAPGDCFDAGADGEHVTRISCDAPHDEQIFDRVDVGLGSDAYPGAAALRDSALESCRGEAVAYFVEGTPPPSLQFLVHFPSQGSWVGGIRTATCTFGQIGGKLTAFVQP
ncbi:septum formation family protein [Amycolatopsis sp. cmx-8-4]|uniref:DUF4190 domain-containing protein n=1 Tax=Amycolatopsis sp. cmx-8-4 TaxID=2790947 RepID=UPI00397E6A29